MKDDWDNLILWLKDMGLTPSEIVSLVRAEVFRQYTETQHNDGNNDKTNQCEQSH